MADILLETNKGIIFEKTTTKRRCRVNVKNKDDGYVHMTYHFNKDVEPITSPYISWENLNCCGGWDFDKSYLLTAVQEGKKLCSGIIFDTEKELNDYIDNLTDDYLYFCKPPMQNGPHTFYYIDIVRNGSIKDYINEKDILRIYDELGIKNFNKKLLSNLLELPTTYVLLHKRRNI